MVPVSHSVTPRGVNHLSDIEPELLPPHGEPPEHLRTLALASASSSFPLKLGHPLSSNSIIPSACKLSGGGELFGNLNWLLAIGYWLLAVGYWLWAIGCGLWAIGLEHAVPVRAELA
ncbi:hypothetical protein N9N28_15680 [Rubripirellula amarantea]|nr:hypothetical protein [Rubripirellula amarantea]